MRHLWPNGSTTIPTVTSEFGMRVHPIFGTTTLHAGIDLVGFPLNLSSAAGVVTFAKFNGGAGNEVRVRHDDGTETRYKHNASFLVQVGDRVEAATPVGVMGSTGDSTGDHLHFETRDTPTSAARNPRDFINDHLYDTASTPTKTTRKRVTMIPLLIVDGANKLGGGTRTFTFAPGLFIETTGQKSANDISAILLAGTGKKTPNLSYADLAVYARASNACDPDLLARIEAAAV